MNRPSGSGPRSRLGPLVVLAACLAATVAATLVVRRGAEDRDLVRFDDMVRARRVRVEAVMDSFAQFMVATAEFIEADEDPDREEFERFVERQRIHARYPGAAGAAYSRRVPREQSGVLARELAELYGPGVEPHPATDAPYVNAIVMLGPRDGGLDSILGLDLAAEPVRREALGRALATERVAVSRLVPLQGLEEAPRGFVVFARVSALREPGTRRVRDTIAGFVSSAFRAEEFLAGVSRADGHEVDVALAIGEADEPPVTSPGRTWPADPRHAAVTTLDVGGVPWHLHVATTPEFERDSRLGQEWWVLAVGAAASALLFVLARREVAAREALGRSEELFRQMAETVADVFWIADAARGGVVYASPRFADIFDAPGVAVSDASRTWASRLHPEDRDRVTRASQESEASGNYDETYRIVRRDGSVRWIHDRAYPVRGADGRVVRTIGIARDITRARLAEAALRVSEERFREITENLREVVWVTGPDGMSLQYVSPSFERIWGRPRSDLETQPQAWLDAIHADDRARIAAAVPRALDGTYDELYRVVRPDGSVRWIRDRASPVRDESGAVVRVIGTAADVTELRAAQDEVERQAEHLRQAQKMEAVGRLAGGVAHDFNNLLTVICGFARMAIERRPPGDPTAPWMQHVLMAGERAAALTKQLLAFSRKQVLQPTVLEPDAVLREMVPMLRRLIGEDVFLEFSPGAPGESVLADRTQLEQVILNLAVNARDAMPSGGNLRISTAAVFVRAARPASDTEPGSGPWVRICVADTGTGMDAETCTRIFEPFFTTKGVGKGTGLGLSTVYGVVRQSGGHVSVRSAPGAGTEFQVHLPRTDTAPEAAAAEPQRASGGRETLLVVEDEETVRGLITAVLAGAGYRVLEAPSGSEAVALVRTIDDAVDLVLTDTVMPGMNGRETADALLEIRPGAAVVFMSGYADRGIVDENGLTEGTEFLAKPFSPAVLLRRIREVLDSRAAGRSCHPAHATVA